MTMTKREKTLVWVLFILILICAYWLLYLQPYIDDMNSLKDQISSKQADFDIKAQQQIKNNELIKNLSDDQQQVEKLKAGINHGYDQPAILVYLEETVKAHAKKQTFMFSETRQTRNNFV